MKSREMCTGEIHAPLYYGFEHKGQQNMINISIGNWNCLTPTLMSTKDQQMSWNLALFTLDNRLPFKHIIHVWNHSWYNVFTVSESRTMKLKLQIGCILQLEILHHYAWINPGNKPMNEFDPNFFHFNDLSGGWNLHEKIQQTQRYWVTKA